MLTSSFRRTLGIHSRLILASTEREEFVGRNDRWRCDSPFAHGLTHCGISSSSLQCRGHVARQPLPRLIASLHPRLHDYSGSG